MMDTPSILPTSAHGSATLCACSALLSSVVSVMAADIATRQKSPRLFLRNNAF